MIEDGKKMTTASHRNAARLAEKALNWASAAQSWQAAIDCYPNAAGALAKADIEKMASRRDAAKDKLQGAL